MSKLAGAPVRLQLMRWDEQGWTRYGPAIMHDMRARHRRQRQHRRLRGDAVRAGRAPATAAVAPARSARSAAPGSGGTNAENLAPMYKVANAQIAGTATG